MSLPEKLKIRISHFAFVTIKRDCIRFGCVKKDGSANISGFINELLPTLVFKREQLHKKIKHKSLCSKMIKPVVSRDENTLIGELETIMDMPNSVDYLLDELSEEIWLRPDKKTYKLYERIWNAELPKYGFDFSKYIRFMLNDYCSLQQFKREELYCYKAINAIRNTTEENNAVEAIVKGNHQIIIPIEFYSDYFYTNTTYLIYAKEWDTNHIYLANLIEINVISTVESSFKLEAKQVDCAYELISNEIDVTNKKVVSIK